MTQKNIRSVGLITYQTNHLKTEQVFENLIKNYPRFEYTFYALPFIERPKRKVFLEHRPSQDTGMNTKELADKYNCDYVICKDDTDIKNGEDIYLILGAGILSRECVENKKILNIHPGIIPTSRGLDAFKWAIYENNPVGNTLHFINAEVDAGEIIAVIKTPIYKEDTLKAFARRHYNKEIDMMSNFIEYLKHPINECPDAKMLDSKKRMPYELETELPAKFEKLRLLSPQKTSRNESIIESVKSYTYHSERNTDMERTIFTLPGGGGGR